MVGLSVERFLAAGADSRRRQHSTSVCTPLVSRITVISCVLLGLILYINMSLVYTVIYTPFGTLCIPLPNASNSIQMLSKLDAIFNFIIPFVIILILNIGSVYRLQAPYQHERTQSRRGEIFLNNQRKTERRMSLLTLPICIFYLFFTSPSHGLSTMVMMSPPSESFIGATETFLYQQLLLYVLFTRP